MSPAEFERFLKETFTLLARFSADGSVHFEEFAKDDAVLAATGQTFAQAVKGRARSKKGAA
jgi:hypothetical protein